MMKKTSKIIILITFIMFYSILTANAKDSKIHYATHVQTYGWQESVDEGELSGTTGEAKRLEAIKISLSEELTGSVDYLTYTQTYGWLDWVKDGEMSGTEGEAKRLEAIRIQLSGNIAEEYDIYYRVHSQTYGWLGWAKNGEIAGTLSLGKRLEAIEIKLLSKEESIETGDSFVFPEEEIKYQSHVQSYGWQEPVSNGKLSGTTGKAKRLEAIAIEVFSLTAGTIEYTSLIEGIGWEDRWKRQGEISGTEGEARKLEAIRIRLTGALAEKYDVYYHVHIQGYGWLGWAKNGEIAGSVNYHLRLEAIEIKLVEKTTGEGTGNSYIEKDAYVKYASTIKDIGEQEEVSEGELSGTVGQKKAMQAIRVYLDTQLEGNVLYQTYEKRGQWEEDWKSNNELSGVVEETKNIQLIRIKLEGQISEKYDIYYRVHTDKFGWLGWAKNGEEAGVNHYDMQAIEIKLFLKVDSNQYLLDTANHYVEKVYYLPKYYNQKDPNWANRIYGPKTFGGTGCAPTSMAMAFTGILGKTVLPYEVAEYLYNETSEYNKYAIGSSGYAIIYASDYYDVKCTPIKSVDEMRDALENGKILFAAMGDGKFGTKNWNHAITLFSYSNGNTIAYDPLKTKNNGWVSLQQLWREQSKDPDDSKGGSNFYSLERY